MGPRVSPWVGLSLTTTVVVSEYLVCLSSSDHDSGPFCPVRIEGTVNNRNKSPIYRNFECKFHGTKRRTKIFLLLKCYWGIKR